ncbi:hypothetical protein F4823DRAFT_564744 [Ustulina deusta]|nr:hypothetical protein F4823DRAFT_564744 [Ustulina deusta]
MERDSRRDRGEWRGCHNFDKIICDGDVPTTSERRGGLKMGQRYYYYYEVDGSTETHNPSLPTTTACPFLPGQTVNTLDVPLERRTRLKSASMNSLRNTDYKTMDPIDRFATPRPAPVPGNRREFRLASASSILPKRATRSVSPAPSWTGTARRILGFRLRDREAERGRKSTLSEMEDVFVEVHDPSLESRSVTPSGSIRSRELSPESLRRFLSDDLPSASATTEPAPGFSIPDDIEEETEENDDDDNFANTTVSENTSFTNLSPPPFQRGGLSAPPASHSRNTTTQTLAAPVFNAKGNLANEQQSTVAPTKLDIPRSHSTLSVASSSLASAASPRSNISQGLSQFSFFDDSDDDEDLASYEGEQTLLGDMKQDNRDNDASGLRAPITSYSLPRALTDNKHSNTRGVLQSLESPALVSQTHNSSPVDTNSLFGLPNVDIGLDDLVGDVNWMNDVIREKPL